MIVSANTAPVEPVDDDKTFVSETACSPDILQALEAHLPAETAPKAVTPQDPEWTKYVISLLSKDELVNGHPTCAGLRRIFDKYFTTIRSEMDVLQCPDPTNSGRATVKCSIQYVNKGSFDLDLRQYISDVADCFRGNTEAPYCDHPVATAATLAEGRALRKALRVNVITSDEASKVDAVVATSAREETSNGTPIASNQVKLINKTFAQLGVSPQRTLEHLISTKKLPQMVTVVEDMSYEEAQKVLRTVQVLGKDPKKGGEIIPEGLFLTPEEKKKVTK